MRLQVLEGLSDTVAATYLPLLHRLVDAVALLDMLAGFARVAAGGIGGVGVGDSAQGRQQQQQLQQLPYVRPVLTEGGPIAIVEGRHPVLERQLAGGEGGAAAYQPNDTYLALNSSFHVITGRQ